MQLRKSVALGALAMAAAILGAQAVAQHGHPLVGTWSGERVNGQPVRVLLMLEFSEDQKIAGTLIEGRSRMRLTDARLDPSDWSVTLRTQRQVDGQAVDLEIQGKIENLGSTTERAINGTWREGERSGPFRVVMN